MPRALGERSPEPQRGSLQKASWSTRHRGWGDVNWKAPAGKARQRDPPPRENGGGVGEKWHLKDTASRLKRSGSCKVRAREHPPLSASSRGARGPCIASCSPSHRLFICEPHNGIVPNDVSGEVVTWKPHLEKVRRELSPACGTGEGAAKSQEGVRTSSHRSTRNRQRGAWKRLAPRRGPGGNPPRSRKADDRRLQDARYIPSRRNRTTSAPARGTLTAGAGPERKDASSATGRPLG